MAEKYIVEVEQLPGSAALEEVKREGDGPTSRKSGKRVKIKDEKSQTVTQARTERTGARRSNRGVAHKYNGRTQASKQLNDSVQDMNAMMAAGKDLVKQLTNDNQTALAENTKLTKELGDAKAKVIAIETATSVDISTRIHDFKCTYKTKVPMKMKWFISIGLLVLAFFLRTMAEKFELLSFYLDTLTVILCFVGSLGVSYVIMYFILCRHVTHHWKFLRVFNHDHFDRRADNISLGELKHLKPEYAEVSLIQRQGPFKLLDAKFIISFEVLSQLLDAAVLSLSSPSDVVWDRIQRRSSSLHSVSVDRYLSIAGIHAVQDSCLVAYAIYRQMMQGRVRVDFPRTPVA